MIYLLAGAVLFACLTYFIVSVLNMAGSPIGTSQYAFLMGNLNGELSANREIIVPDSIQDIEERNNIRFASFVT